MSESGCSLLFNGYERDFRFTVIKQFSLNGDVVWNGLFINMQMYLSPITVKHLHVNEVLLH